MEFSRQEYWSVLPFPPRGDIPNPKIKPKSIVSSALSGGFLTTSNHLGSPLQAVWHSQGKKHIFLGTMPSKIPEALYHYTLHHHSSNYVFPGVL